MPTSSTLALQTAIIGALKSDTALTLLLNGDHIYDHVPQGQPYPYVALHQINTRTTAPGLDEHELILHIWSDTPGRKHALEISYALRTILHDQPLTLTDHALINLRFTSATTRREKEQGVYQAVIRFRAVTEQTP